MALLGFFVCLGGAALNVAMYLNAHNPVSIFAAIFCGGIALWILATEATS